MKRIMAAAAMMALAGAASAQTPAAAPTPAATTAATPAPAAARSFNVVYSVSGKGVQAGDFNFGVKSKAGPMRPAPRAA